MARKDDASNRLYDGDFGKVRRAAPAVDGECERAAYPGIVEGLPLLVGNDQQIAVPVAFLNGNLVPKGAFQEIAAPRREAPKLD